MKEKTILAENSLAVDFHKKHRLGPQNDSGSLGLEKNSKNSKLC